MHRGSHAHEFDAPLFVLEGSITLVFGADRGAYSSEELAQYEAGLARINAEEDAARLDRARELMRG